MATGYVGEPARILCHVHVLAAYFVPSEYLTGQGGGVQKDKECSYKV